MMHLSTSTNLHVPCTNLAFLSHSFCTAASATWNTLPSSIHSSQMINSFRRYPETQFFNLLLTNPSDQCTDSLTIKWLPYFTNVTSCLLTQYSAWNVYRWYVKDTAYQTILTQTMPQQNVKHVHIHVYVLMQELHHGLIYL